MWNALNGELKITFSVPRDVNSAVRCCRFSPVSEILISGHDNGKVVVCILLKKKLFILVFILDVIQKRFYSQNNFIEVSFIWKTRNH